VRRNRGELETKRVERVGGGGGERVEWSQPFGLSAFFTFSPYPLFFFGVFLEESTFQTIITDQN